MRREFTRENAQNPSNFMKILYSDIRVLLTEQEYIYH